MHKDLPAPPGNKTGWPWTSDLIVNTDYSTVKNWPKISVVIPTYNHARYLEQTIRSVLLQRYPNTELIVIDGGSTDSSVDIIHKYEDFLTYWVSEKDRGQSHAINKGMLHANGSILAYINSDDFYLPDAFFTVAKYHLNNQDTDLIYGICSIINESGHETDQMQGDLSNLYEIINLWDVWWNKKNYVQPEVFWTRQATLKTGSFREELHYVMDYDYWLRIFMAGGKAGKIDKPLSAFRITPEQKSRQSLSVAVEILDVVKPVLWNNNIPIPFWYRVKLQSKWLYQHYFMSDVEKSLSAGESKRVRWLRLLLVIARHPKILVNSSFWRRFKSIFHKSISVINK